MQDHPAGRFVFTATGPAYFRIWIDGAELRLEP